MNHFQYLCGGSGEVAQWVIILVTLPEGLRSAPVPSVDGSSLLVTLVPTGSVTLFWPLQTMHPCAHTHTDRQAHSGTHINKQYTK